MTPTPFIRISTCEELRGQQGLHPLLELFSASSRLGPELEPDRLIYMDLPAEGIALIEATRTSEGIAVLQQVMFSPEVRHEHRLAMWQAGIAWAKSKNPVAIQVFCLTKEDGEILAELGFPITTEILLFGRDSEGGSGPIDQAIHQTTYEQELPALVSILERTLVDSQDIPESISLHRPLDLLQSWVEGSLADETVVLVAESQNERVGLLVATLERYAEGMTGYQIQYLGVAPAHRRQGWGSRLLKQFLQVAQAGGVQKISVFTDHRNLPAIQLYKQFGFGEFEELRMPIVFQRVGQLT